ncbi:MAG: type II toxin-antitoxin system Phd/YefM family antitoxin [Desulfovermiculus sp.]
MKTISSRDFNQHASEVKRTADHEPVMITNRGRPAHVLLSVKEYRKLTGTHPKITELLAMPGSEDIELEIPCPDDLAQPADFS